MSPRPIGSQRQAVQDSEPGALQHRISDQPVLAPGRGQALSVPTRRFASSFVLADTYHSIAGREDRILEGGPAAVRGLVSRWVLPVGGAEARSGAVRQKAVVSADDLSLGRRG